MLYLATLYNITKKTHLYSEEYLKIISLIDLKNKIDPNIYTKERIQENKGL